MKRSVFFLTGCLFLFLGPPVFAQLILDKREIKLEVKPGEVVSGVITVSNPSDKEATLNTLTQDFAYKSPYLGFKTVLPMGTTPYSCAKWITVATPVFMVPAKGKQEVSYAIKVPADARGGYYAVLFFEKGEGAITGEKGVGIRELAGCAFFLETTDKEKHAKIENIAVGEEGLQGKLSNAGDCVLILEGSFYIMDNKGMVADRGQIQKYYLPPQEEVPFVIKVSDRVPVGTYTLVINFDSQETGALIKEVDFSKDKAGKLNIGAMRD
jgi:hypothetical protein